MYADLTGNRKKRRIKSLRDNKCEGRMIYDCFVLNEKREAIFYQGNQAVLGALDVRSYAIAAGKTAIMVNGAFDTTNYTYYYKMGASAEKVNYTGSAFTTTGWTAMTTNPADASGAGIAGTQGNFVTVVQLNGSGVAVAAGSAVVNVG